MKTYIYSILLVLVYSQLAFSAKVYEMDPQYFEKSAPGSNQSKHIHEITALRITPTATAKASQFPIELNIDGELFEDGTPMPPIKSFQFKTDDLAQALKRFLEESKNIHLVTPYFKDSMTEEELLGQLAFYDEKTKQVHRIPEKYTSVQLKRKIEQLTYLEIYRRHDKQFETSLNTFLHLIAEGNKVTLPKQVADYQRYMRQNREIIEFLDGGGDSDFSQNRTSPR